MVGCPVSVPEVGKERMSLLLYILISWDSGIFFFFLFIFLVSSFLFLFLSHKTTQVAGSKRSYPSTGHEERQEIAAHEDGRDLVHMYGACTYLHLLTSVDQPDDQNGGRGISRPRKEKTGTRETPSVPGWFIWAVRHERADKQDGWMDGLTPSSHGMAWHGGH